MSVVAIDFETANERRDSACAVGLAWIEGGRVVRRESRLIRPPQLRFSPGNIRVHGILPADVRDAPTFPEVIAEFLPDLSGGLMLAHNAGFDMGVLAASLAAWGEPVPDMAGHCTLQIARRVFPDPAGHGLAKVASRLGIRFEHHDAGEDAFACAEIALAALRETGATDIADLARGLGLIPTRALTTPRRDMTRSTSAKALRASGIVDLRPSNALRFAMRGSTGNRYLLEFEERTDGPYLRCSCPAGTHRRRCRHVDALVEGDITELTSNNFDDVERLRQLLDGKSVGPVRIKGVAAA
ncbi:3'-5' exonuclease [Methylobacterium sp. AMS5]|uniref:3'-5' exonuclease n=1 Tax=Methylobacterium sp. AMS5 TaxID=925818 RepID=UPI00074F8A8D|nr:3'-5' exonuclease [Methylobacterium sp. AMS5]AMB43475.1 DNA polymerase III [Methylobacterium sp. AMS5]